METKATRIVQIRKKLNYSQRQFAKQMNRSGSNISQIESETIPVTESVITDIVATFNVNREWLENGTGEMFMSPQKETLSTPAWAEELMKKIDKLMDMQSKNLEKENKLLDLLGKPLGNQYTGMLRIVA